MVFGICIVQISVDTGGSKRDRFGCGFLIRPAGWLTVTAPRTVRIDARNTPPARLAELVWTLRTTGAECDVPACYPMFVFRPSVAPF